MALTLGGWLREFDRCERLADSGAAVIEMPTEATFHVGQFLSERRRHVIRATDLPEVKAFLARMDADLARDPLEDAATDLSRAIAEIHDLLREAKTAKDQGRQGAIYYRVVTLKGFLDALAIDARRDLDALKDLPL